jgi:hypothetical protein
MAINRVYSKMCGMDRRLENIGNNIKIYYREINKIEYDNNDNSEKIVRDRIANEENGETEVKCGSGYIDVVTNEEIIEVKKAENWKYAIGQILAYHEEYQEKTMRIHIFDGTLTDYVKNICSRNNIRVTHDGN